MKENMKRNYVRLGIILLAASVAVVNNVYAAGKGKKKEKENTEQNANIDSLIINGTNQTASFFVDPQCLTEDSIEIIAPNGFVVSPNRIPANSGKTEVAVLLKSTQSISEGKIVLKSGDAYSYVPVKGYASALPVKQELDGKKGTNTENFSSPFQYGENGYTLEFKVQSDMPGKDFYPYFVDKDGYGLKAYITSDGIGLYSGENRKGLSNPASGQHEGGSGKFYNNDGLAHIYRIAVTSDKRAFIFRDNLPVDTVRLADYGPQPNFADGIGDLKENLLRNGGFEGEFNTEDKIAKAIEGWDIVIGDRWNSEQYILPREINKELDYNNHIFQIKPYKWRNGWSDGILEQVVDVAPNETYTLSALVKGGVSKKKGTTGKIIIDEAQDHSKQVVTEIISDEWETYSLDYTTSAECKQLRIKFTVGKGTWGGDITPLEVDNAKLTGVSRTYTPKFGFENKDAELEYFLLDESGAYAPNQPTIKVTIKK